MPPTSILRLTLLAFLAVALMGRNARSKDQVAEIFPLGLSDTRYRQKNSDRQQLTGGHFGTSGVVRHRRERENLHNSERRSLYPDRELGALPPQLAPQPIPPMVNPANPYYPPAPNPYYPAPNPYSGPEGYNTPTFPSPYQGGPEGYNPPAYPSPYRGGPEGYNPPAYPPPYQGGPEGYNPPAYPPQYHGPPESPALPSAEPSPRAPD